MESPMMRSLPQSIEAEQSVIGAMIIDKSAIAEDDFYRDGHKAIYKAIKEMYAKDMAVDLVTILEYLKTTDMLDKAGGVTYISELSASVPTTANLSSYIKIVEEKSTLRKLIKASTSIIEESYNSGGDVEKVIDLAQKKVFDIAEKKDSKEYESLSNVLERGFLEIERQVSTEVEPLKRIKNFNEFHKPLSRDEQSCQGARCMDCGVPFCQNGKMIQGMVSGCPLNNLIPEWNDLIFHKNYKAALKRLLKTNNFPEFTSRVCPALCEAACTCGLNGNPVTVRENENAIIETAYASNWMQPHPPKHRIDKKIAIIGSGPSGLAAADQLNKRGYQVTVFEREDRLGGLLMYGIPNMKLEKHIIDRRIELMEEEGVVFKTNAGIENKKQVQQLYKEFDRVILACG